MGNMSFSFAVDRPQEMEQNMNIIGSGWKNENQEKTHENKRSVKE